MTFPFLQEDQDYDEKGQQLVSYSVSPKIKMNPFLVFISDKIALPSPYSLIFVNRETTILSISDRRKDLVTIHFVKIPSE